MSGRGWAGSLGAVDSPGGAIHVVGRFLPPSVHLRGSFLRKSSHNVTGGSLELGLLKKQWEWGRDLNIHVLW